MISGSHGDYVKHKEIAKIVFQVAVPFYTLSDEWSKDYRTLSDAVLNICRENTCQLYYEQGGQMGYVGENCVHFTQTLKH